MPKETLTTKVARLEEKVEARKEIIDLQFQNVNTKLDNIEDFLRNGLSAKIVQTMKNGYSSNKKVLGVPPEVRSKLWTLFIRFGTIIMYGLAGYLGLDFLTK